MSPAAGRRPLTLLWGERHHPDLDAARRLRGGAPKRKRAEDVVDLTADSQPVRGRQTAAVPALLPPLRRAAGCL